VLSSVAMGQTSHLFPFNERDAGPRDPHQRQILGYNAQTNKAAITTQSSHSGGGR